MIASYCTSCLGVQYKLGLTFFSKISQFRLPCMFAAMEMGLRFGIRVECHITNVTGNLFLAFPWQYAHVVG